LTGTFGVSLYTVIVDMRGWQRGTSYPER